MSTPFGYIVRTRIIDCADPHARCEYFAGRQHGRRTRRIEDAQVFKTRKRACEIARSRGGPDALVRKVYQNPQRFGVAALFTFEQLARMR
jgi:hypothetical protein